MNLVYCHGCIKKSNSTVILVCRSCLVHFYLAKGFVILEHNYKQLSSVPNDVKLIIHAIDKQKTDYIMACTTENISAAKTMKKLHINSPLSYVYRKKIIVI